MKSKISKLEYQELQFKVKELQDKLNNSYVEEDEEQYKEDTELSFCDGRIGFLNFEPNYNDWNTVKEKMKNGFNFPLHINMSDEHNACYQSVTLEDMELLRDWLNDKINHLKS